MVSSMVPTLVVRSADLLKDGRAVDVAMPNVFLQITDWWKGGKCKVNRLHCFVVPADTPDHDNHAASTSAFHVITCRLAGRTHWTH